MRSCSNMAASAPIFVAERIGALAVKGNIEWRETWKQITHRMDQFMKGPNSLS